jgi:hypothetical protein
MEENKDTSNNCAMSGSKPESEYKVGKGHPPLETRFKPGNKMGKGKPKGLTNIQAKLIKFSKLKAPEQYAEALKEVFPSLKNKDLTVDDAMWIKVLQEAMLDQGWAARHFIADRLEGKPKESSHIDHTTDGEKITSTVINVVDNETSDMLNKIMNPQKETLLINDNEHH